MKRLMTTDIFNYIATASPFYDDHHNDDKMTLQQKHLSPEKALFFNGFHP